MNKRGNNERKIKIIDTASELFAQKDFYQVCMDDIAVKARVGKGTLYNYFTSKENLYFSIIQYRLNKLIEILDKAYDERNDPVFNLKSYILHLHKFLAKHQHFYLIWKRDELPNGAGELHQLKDRINQTAEKIIHSGCKAGYFRCDIDVKIAGRIILQTINCLKKDKRKVPEKEQQIDAILSILLQGIGTEKADVTKLERIPKHKIRKGDTTK